MAALEVPFPGVLSGTITAVVTDPHDPGTPQTIIERDDDWHVIVDWQLDGPLAPFMAGEFTVKCYLESVADSAFEGQIGPTIVVNLNTTPALPTPRKYHSDFTMVAASNPAAGVYKMTTVLTYKHLGVPLELAGFVEGPMIQLYDAVGNNP